MQIVAADVNGDGKLDLIYLGSGGLYVALGNGDGTFQSPGSSLESNSLYWVVAADFNGDGKLDLAVTTNDLGTSGNSIPSSWEMVTARFKARSSFHPWGSVA
jgi:FG-GAP-like repeat